MPGLIEINKSRIISAAEWFCISIYKSTSSRVACVTEVERFASFSPIHLVCVRACVCVSIEYMFVQLSAKVQGCTKLEKK